MAEIPEELKKRYKAACNLLLTCDVNSMDISERLLAEAASNYKGDIERIALREAEIIERIARHKAEIVELQDRMDALRIWAVLLDAELPTDFEPDLATEDRIAAFAKYHEKLDSSRTVLLKVLTLAEHKIDQHLQGQYPDGKALGSTLATIRATVQQEQKELGWKPC